jgi:hypothetical protein
MIKKKDMFGLIEIVQCLTYMAYFGFIIASISGFVKIQDTYDGQIFIISLLVLVNTSVYAIVDLSKNRFFENLNNYYCRSYFLLNASALLISISSVGIGFGIWGLIICIANFFVGVFLNDIKNNRLNVIDPNTNEDDNVNVNVNINVNESTRNV